MYLQSDNSQFSVPCPSNETLTRELHIHSAQVQQTRWPAWSNALRIPEPHQFDVGGYAVLHGEDVLWMDVQVCYALPMKVLHALYELPADVDNQWLQ